MPAEMNGRLQLLHEPGEFGKIGQVWFLESLADDELHTGRRLREDLQDLLLVQRLNVPVRLRRVATRIEFFSALKELRLDVERTGINPILDIECHGDEDRGLQLADKTVVSWTELKTHLEAINLAARFNLVLVLGCCSGAYFAREARLYECAAFVGFIGPAGPVDARTLEAALRAFYSALFAFRDIAMAIDAMRAAAPGFGYLFSTAFGLFWNVFSMLIREDGTGEGLLRRAEAFVRRSEADGGRPVDVEGVAKFLTEMEPIYFEQMRRAYFAIGLFPENDIRFRMTYAEVRAYALAKSSSSPAGFAGLPPAIR